ncbi:MAG: PLP-dependent aminotransferase family protein [Chloroflexota bacterium]
MRELLKVTERPRFISFAGGLPAPELFPTEKVASVCQDILRESGPVALQYSATEGYRPLRELIAQRMRSDGVKITTDNVLITTGSQQAIDLLGKILIDPGDAVVVESPTYLAALQAWRAYEADFVGVVSDECGMDVDRLETMMHRRTKIIYCLPNFQNPGGVTLSEERRKQLVEVSRRYGVALIEDDPYRDLRFEGDHLSRLITLESAMHGGHGEYSGNVVSLSTFSKILAPGLRVGWVIAAAEVIAQLTQAKQGTDLHTSTLDQMIAHEMLRSGFLEDHKRVIAGAYRERRDAMLEALAHEFPSDARWTRPQGGMFLWVELPPSIDATDLLTKAMERRVAFVPGQAFHVDGRGHNTMRLNFSNSTPAQIREGVGLLGRALQQMRGGRTDGLGPTNVADQDDRSARRLVGDRPVIAGAID